MNDIVDTSNESNRSYTSLCSSVTLQSDRKGFFQQLVDCIANSLDEKWFYNFGKLKSNEERIEKCLNDEQVTSFFCR